MINRAVLHDFQPHLLAIEETPPSPFTRTVLWLLVALLLTAALWSWISRIPIMTTAPGKFASDAHTKVVQSLNAGTVSNILVKTGDFVRKGQILATLDPKIDLAKVDSAGKDLSLNRVQQRRILGELGDRSIPTSTSGVAPEIVAVESRVAASQLASQQSKVALDEAQIREAKANMASAEATLEAYVARAAQDGSLARAAAPLVAKGALSGQAYTQLEDQVIVDEGQVKAQRQQIRATCGRYNCRAKAKSI